jgi:hypothetical protein
LESPDHVAGADGPRELAEEASHAPERARDEPKHTAHDQHPGDDRQARWSTPVAAVRPVAEPEVTRRLDVAPPPAVSEERQREPIQSEQPVEEDDPSKPTRKGWWQRRFTGA